MKNLTDTCLLDLKQSYTDLLSQWNGESDQGWICFKF